MTWLTAIDDKFDYGTFYIKYIFLLSFRAMASLHCVLNEVFWQKKKNSNINLFACTCFELEMNRKNGLSLAFHFSRLNRLSSISSQIFSFHFFLYASIFLSKLLEKFHNGSCSNILHTLWMRKLRFSCNLLKCTVF